MLKYIWLLSKKLVSLIKTCRTVSSPVLLFPFQSTLVRDPRLRPEFFSGFLFATACISCVYNCNDLPSNKSSLRSSHIWFSYIYNFIIILSRVYHELIQRPAPSWLVNLIGRALHQYRRCQGFESRTSLNFFFRLSFSQLHDWVAYTTAMIFLQIILHSAVHIYVFHIFIISKVKLVSTNQKHSE